MRHLMAVVMLIWIGAGVQIACNSNHTVGQPGPVGGPEARASAKLVSSYNPFIGKDEDGYAKGIGSPEAVQRFLELFSVQIVSLSESVRQELAKVLTEYPDQEASIAEIGLSHPKILEALAAEFKQSVRTKDISGGLADAVLATEDGDAVLTAAQGLFGLRLRVRNPVGKTDEWLGDPVPVFFNPITDEKDTDWIEGFDPDGTSVRYSFESSVPYQSLYVFQDEEFFQRPENTPIALADTPSPYRPFFGVVSDLIFPIFPTPVYAATADDDNCGDRAQLWIRGIRIYNTHESNDNNPEIYALTGGRILKKDIRKDLRYVNKINKVYSEDDYSWLPALAYPVSGEYCYNLDSENYAKVHWRIMEDDRWPNPDDKVARWRDTWTVYDRIYLPRSDCTSGDNWEDNADLWVGSYDDD